MTASFKAVLLEAVGVVFIVTAVGSAHGMVVYAASGGACGGGSGFAVGSGGAWNLDAGPGNMVKFVLGLMLTAFGIFWTGDGSGADWPGADLVLLVLLVGSSWGLVRIRRGMA